MESVSIVIPAFQEQSRIGNTLAALKSSGDWYGEIIVVDDGSSDSTYFQALKETPHVFRLKKNSGKTRAIQFGVERTRFDVLLFLDADLEGSARQARSLVEPIWNNEADMTIASLPPATAGGFGLVKTFAAREIQRKTGVTLQSPLSGQRALWKKDFNRYYRGDRGFGLEVGLTVDYLKAKKRIKEIDIHFTHRQTGKNLEGFVHRFKQGMAVLSAFQSRK